jgi:hypothetical protein
LSPSKNGECDFRGDVGGKRSEDSPPQDSRREHAPGSQTISKPASERLKKSVAYHEGAGERSRLNVCQMEFGGDGVPGDGDVDAVDIRDGAQNEEPKNEEPAHVAFRRPGHKKFPVLRPKNFFKQSPLCGM